MAGLTTCCIGYARRIATEIAVPGAIPDDDRAPPDIVITRTARSTLQDGGELRRDGDTLHFTPPGIAHYAITSTDITVVPSCADEEAITALLIATALPALLWMGGAFVLHAAAAILPGHDRAVAIAAPSGTGKSTMLAELIARGARIVADDSICLRRSEGGIVASGLAGGYFTGNPASSERRFVAAPCPHAGEVSLGAILLLARHARGAPATIRRLAPFAALAAVLANRHRPAVPALFGDPARRLADATQIARIPAYLWSRPDGAPRLTNTEWHAINDSVGDGHG